MPKDRLTHARFVKSLDRPIPTLFLAYNHPSPHTVLTQITETYHGRLLDFPLG